MAEPSDDLLARGAAMARKLAPQLCRKNSAAGESCDWYHGLWQDLRLLGLAATPEQQADFFRNSLARFSKRSPRLLISGSADYSILAHVLSACARNQIAADITVMDICETPLYFNRWYAEQMGFRIHTIQTNILDHSFEPEFDAIYSHGFLGLFPQAQRARLVQQWGRALKPGGVAISVNRIRPGASGGEVKFSESQGHEFCNTLAAKLQDQALAESERSAILNRAKIYVERLVGYSLPQEELTALFQEAGFRMDECQIISTGASRGKPGGPAIPSHAQHACVIAAKFQ
ncbi:MAG TPA: class I SAM-dependent methyltransferase [Verrucomicrobiae bacterium]|jgi:SAM-dependent methyltransferase|nr:class I SAM-dependent methyltransferase [Verrucomicrobiae bacterium]